MFWGFSHKENFVPFLVLERASYLIRIAFLFKFDFLCSIYSFFFFHLRELYISESFFWVFEGLFVFEKRKKKCLSLGENDH